MKFKHLVFVVLCTSNFAQGSGQQSFLNWVSRAADAVRENVASVKKTMLNIASLPEVLPIAQNYQDRIKCPENLNPDLFKSYVFSEFRNRVIGKELKEIVAYDEEDKMGIVSVFGRELEESAKIGTEKLQADILALNVSVFSLVPLSSYNSIIQLIKNEHPRAVFNDQLLIFATHLFDKIPHGQRQFFVNNELKKRAIGQIYNEILDFFAQADPVSHKDQNGEKMFLFLSVWQHFLQNNKLHNFYVVTNTKLNIDFNANPTTKDKVAEEIFETYNRLQLQPRIKSWKAERDEKLFKATEQQRKLQAHFDRQVAEWQKTFDSLNEEWDFEQKTALQAIESERLNFEIKLIEYQEMLKKIEKLTKYLEQEKNNHGIMMLDFENKRLNLLIVEAKKLANEMEKKIKQTESGCWNEIKNNFEHDMAGLAVVQRFEHGMWNTFKKYLRESRELLKNGEERKARVLLKEQERKVEGLLNQNNNQSRRAWWVVWLRFAKEQKIEKDKIRLIQKQQEFENNSKYMDNCIPGIEQIIKEEDQAREILDRAKKDDEICAQIREKKRTSLAVVQRFMLENLQKLRMGKEEVAKIKRAQILEKLLKIQFSHDSEEISPISSELSLQKTARPSLKQSAVVQENQDIRVQAAPMIFNRASVVRVHNPYGENDLYLGQEEGSESSGDNGYNPWTQDEHGNWYYDGYPVYWDQHGQCQYVQQQPVPVLPSYQQSTAMGGYY